MNLKAMAEKCLDLLYPPSLYCHCCGNIIDESRTYNLCDHCISHIKWDLSEAETRKGMKVLRCTEYGLYTRTLIFSLKYNGKKYIARDIAEIADDRLFQAQIDFDVVIPVPMFIGKEKQRGFNQAGLISKYLAQRRGGIYLPHGLIRTENTMPMRGLNPTERQQNIKDKIILNEKWADKIAGKRILLLDDFFTTGSTAKQCVGQLERANPSEIVFISFAAKF